MIERRTDQRLLCAELIQVIYRDLAGHPRRTVANLEDISLCGACIQTERRVPDGTRVIIRYGDGELTGIVKHCCFRDTSYFLGVEFTENCRWSTKHFRPQHLLDPRELVSAAIKRHEETRTTPH